MDKTEQVLLYTIVAGIGIILLVFALSFTLKGGAFLATAEAPLYAWLGFAAYIVVSLAALVKKK